MAGDLQSHSSGDAGPSEAPDDGAAGCRSSTTDDDSEEEADDGEEEEDLSGKRCRAPFSHSWGEMAYHNAMVLGREADGSEEPKAS